MMALPWYAWLLVLWFLGYSICETILRCTRRLERRFDALEQAVRDTHEHQPDLSEIARNVALIRLATHGQTDGERGRAILAWEKEHGTS
jgi:hypothetical protein